MKQLFFILVTVLTVLSCTKCAVENTAITTTVIGVESRNSVTEYGDTIRLGGYGSAIAYNSKTKLFYLLTDRGPNTDYGSGEAKLFPMPNFSPTVGEFKLVGDSLKLIRNIELKDSEGRAILGLPNMKGDGVIGEIAYNPNGERIEGDYFGIDSEGLTLAPDGTLWISDEYAPFILNFTMDGELLRTISPSNVLPEYFAKRRPNRGMEGLTISTDGKRLYGVMQSPLYLPDSRTKENSRNNRIIEISLENDKTREFIYQIEDEKKMVSEILYISDTQMLVLERDGKFPYGGNGFKRIYKIDLSESTDVSGLEIEMLTDEQLQAKGIIPAKKELYIDIVKEIPDYPHDKAEGIAFLENGDLAIINDDDFSIVDQNNTFVPKLQPSGKVDHSTLYIIKNIKE